MNRTLATVPNSGALTLAAGSLACLVLTPMQIRHFRANRAREPDVLWLEATLNREEATFGLAVSRQADGSLLLERGKN